MKSFFVSFILTIAFIVSGIGQAAPTFEEQLTEFWMQKNYAQLQSLLDSKGAASPPDVAALYCGTFFYLLVQPSKEKALAAATKLKAAAEATMNSDFMAFANEQLLQVQGIPDTAFTAPTAEMLNDLHTEFTGTFPNLRTAIGLRIYKTP